MIYTPKQCYDIDELTLYNMHVHLSPYSTCASLEMRVSEVIAECNKQQYSAVAFTNHFHEITCPMESDNKKIRRAASVYQKNFKLYIGMELSAVGCGQTLDTTEQNKSLDYRLYACNHYSRDSWLQPCDRTVDGYINHCFENTKQLILSNKADTVAHPLHGKFIELLEDNTLVTNGYSDDMIAELMTLCKNNDVGWEINLSSVRLYPQLNKRFWNIGKEVGVTFIYGSDAHNLKTLDRKAAADFLKSSLL